MSELKGIYALWYRETKVFLRERSRVISSIINPLLWLLIIGGGLGSAVSFGGVNYQTFIYPGVLIQTALFSSVFFGVYIVWDKKVDFMKEVLVAPMRRTSIFVGKILGGSTDTLLQILILFAIGFILTFVGVMPGLHLTVSSIAISLAFLLMTTIGLVSIGLILGSQMESPEGFQLIISFLVFPLFFLSGSLFPITNLPNWLAPFIFMNPVTYAVDGIRTILIGEQEKVIVGAIQLSPMLDFMIVTLFSIIMIGIGTYAFKKMKL
ncbi:MAG: ABC transporter permease [Candidatus Thermoplasmatota archaeon]|jgi:ABC-2 type transport system permease protein|nr:ABC transporter permease [Candidatus Thermoplasmatota archaeon]